MQPMRYRRPARLDRGRPSVAQINKAAQEARSSLAARHNQNSVRDLAEALDLPMRKLNDRRGYGDLSEHMDLPTRRS